MHGWGNEVFLLNDSHHNYFYQILSAGTCAEREVAHPGSLTLVLYHPPTLTPRMVPVANHFLEQLYSFPHPQFPSNPLLICDQFCNLQAKH